MTTKLCCGIRLPFTNKASCEVLEVRDVEKRTAESFGPEYASEIRSLSISAFLSDGIGWTIGCTREIVNWMELEV